MAKNEENVKLDQEKITTEVNKSEEINFTFNSYLNNIKEIERVGTLIKQDVDNIFHGPRSANNLFIGKDSKLDFININKNAKELLSELQVSRTQNLKEEFNFEIFEHHLEYLKQFDEKSDDFIMKFNLVLASVANQTDNGNNEDKTESSKVSDTTRTTDSYSDVFNADIVTSSPIFKDK